MRVRREGGREGRLRECEALVGNIVREGSNVDLFGELVQYIGSSDLGSSVPSELGIRMANRDKLVSPTSILILLLCSSSTFLVHIYSI